MFVRPEMPLTHRDNGVSMGGSLKEVSILKNCYISADPKGRLNSYVGYHTRKITLPEMPLTVPVTLPIPVL
jgi:hypothetical protein